LTVELPRLIVQFTGSGAAVRRLMARRVPRCVPRVKGKHNGMGISDTWRSFLDANFKVRLTDAQIAKVFPPH
jgi:hypothetical protein